MGRGKQRPYAYFGRSALTHTFYLTLFPQDWGLGGVLFPHVRNERVT